LKILFDIDNVLTPTVLSWLPFFIKDHGVKVRYEDFNAPMLNLPWFDEGVPLNHLISWLVTEGLKLKPQGLVLIPDLSEKHILKTFTDREATMARITRLWLQIGYGEAFSGHFDTKIEGKTKAEICKKEKPDLVIDDFPENVIPIAKLGIPVLMPDCPWNQHVKTGNGITRISGLAEVKKYI